MEHLHKKKPICVYCELYFEKNKCEKLHNDSIHFKWKKTSTQYLSHDCIKLTCNTCMTCKSSYLSIFLTSLMFS